MSPALLVLAALDGAAFVMIGAAGGHGVITDAALQRLFDTASEYHALHALAALATAAVAQRLGPWAYVAVGLMIAGTLFFCGSLYLHAFTGMVQVPFAAPVGGLALILGWLLLAFAGLRAWTRNGPAADRH